ncbi:thioredoxin, putative [Entamoeba histolytica HM-1:IMSS-B]|uniref:Thioredoxin, putative n=6 Tax=Entamoeba histolytica TaxID=5759 RepID=C4M7K9_ENTH1|nr:thioredoxin, putative [Entamoeba histolytica HM-1:IMSS]EMD48971.1 thioredoxin, putative [Entamoeba histolytica KU27]EMH77738.1 thioredoxin, putative [Entamoeba histolytica HM-1:IMSS-B]EMS14558.1 thioredoxin, putative [Entamoeba histolytica HM-3:IMSS]ENY64772.1 thioredoxin, putative [Entamoeba histolytica HM-1:IMSS-A]GAT97517.1 thioredoxin putative [Entamoeba histolytica]|eukprot:XP_651032.1 thioredoxin, putative [Entamoeba histolytica HM-1:IMSS]
MRAFLALCLIAIASANVVSISTANFNDYVKGEKPVFIKFFAPWCGHCKRLAPIYEEFSNVAATEFPNLIVAEVDCTQNQDICEHVQGYPTVILYKGNENIEFEGPRTVEALKEFIAQKI